MDFIFEFIAPEIAAIFMLLISFFSVILLKYLLEKNTKIQKHKVYAISGAVGFTPIFIILLLTNIFELGNDLILNIIIISGPLLIYFLIIRAGLAYNEKNNNQRK